MSKNSNSLTRLIDKYGELISLEELTVILKYKTVGAVRKAHSRGVLPVALYKFPNKYGFYAKTEEVAECLEKMKLSMPV